jgi:DNA repair protein RadC
MAIKHWPETERPREKLLRHGAHMLTDSELLAIFLRTGSRGKSAVDVARELLHEFNGLRSLLDTDKQSFCSINGVGEAKYCLLQAAMEMCKRHLSETISKEGALTNPRLVRNYLTAQLRHRQREVFAVLFLDNQHCLLAFEELFYGTIDGASVYPREVVKQALAHNAAAVILAHNHPSGSTKPSQADRRITQRLQDALKLVDVRVLDHMVVGEAGVVSFAELGLL